jgi:hypothetical protein
MILNLGEGMPSVVETDTLFSAFVTDKPKEVGRLKRHFEALSRSAQPPDDTPKIMDQLTREIEE